MKSQTAQQLINATIAASGKPQNWIVLSKYERGGELKTSAPMTFREARAMARAIREASGYASVERAS